jgi:hypothetical protein
MGALVTIDGKIFDYDNHVLKLLTNKEHAEWLRVTGNHLKSKYIDAIMSSMQRIILLVFGRLPKKYWPTQHQEALKMACNHILKNEGREINFKIVTCDHFSTVFHKIDEEKNVEMEEAITKSQGGILKGRAVNINREALIIQNNAVEDKLIFLVNSLKMNIKI